MAIAIILAIASVVIVALVAWLVVARFGPFLKTGGQSPGRDSASNVTQIRPAQKRKTRRPVRDDLSSVIEEAEAILESGPDQGEAGIDISESSTAVAAEPAIDLVEEPFEPEAIPPKPSFRDRLVKTRQAMGDRLADIRLRRKIDDEIWDDLEEALILADVGVELSVRLVEEARERASQARAISAGEVVDALKSVLATKLSGRDRTLHRSESGPSVWLIVGVNGTGKTTTIGKIAWAERFDGRRVVMAAADTFRAAAADQLEIWSKRSGAELIRGQEGADPGAIVFDAVGFTRARNFELLLIDTAGRLHTKVNLMSELDKIRRVAGSAGGTPDEVLLVLDATTGQNGLVQAREFAAAAGVSGVVLTKLDGTAKGGIAFAIEQEFDIPIKLVGLGEGSADLIEFDPDEFVDAIFES